MSKLLLLLIFALGLAACGNPIPGTSKKRSSSNAIRSTCKTWFDGCNTCSRQPDGTVSCGQKFCQTQGESYCMEAMSPPQPGFAERPAGIPETCMSWNDGCNDCSVNGGQVSCTYRTCYPYGTPYCIY